MVRGMKIEEVLLKAARMLASQALHDLKLQELIRQYKETGEKNNELAQLIHVESERAEAMDEILGLAFENWASHPTYRHYMQCWAFHITGKPEMDVPNGMSDEFRDTIIKKVTDQPDDFASEVGGLMGPVRQLHLDHGVTPTRTSISTGAWVYETPVSDIDFETLNIAARTKFGKALDSGLLRIRRVFNGWRFNAFPRIEDTVAWLKAHSPPEDETKSED